MTDLMMLKAGWLAALLALLPLLGMAQTLATPATPAAAAAAMPAGVALRVTLTPAQLQERLALSPAQQPLWQAFEASLMQTEALRLREVPVLASQNSAAQQLTQRISQQQNRLAALEELELAVKPLLQSLSPAQLALANQYLTGIIPGFSDSSLCPAATAEPRQKGQAGTASKRGRGMGSGL